MVEVFDRIVTGSRVPREPGKNDGRIVPNIVAAKNHYYGFTSVITVWENHGIRVRD